jgi:hypothetical protein
MTTAPCSGRPSVKCIRSLSLVALSTLTACGPSEQQKAELAEKHRIECFDKLCEGDVVPKHDRATDFAFKVNNQWFIAKKAYGG